MPSMKCLFYFKIELNDKEMKVCGSLILLVKNKRGQTRQFSATQNEGICKSNLITMRGKRDDEE